MARPVTRPTAIDRAVAWISPEAGLRRMQARQQLAVTAAKQRYYDAGRFSRGTEGWGVPFSSANAEIYYALPWLRARSHDLTRNNPHARRAVDALTDMLVGEGIRLQPKSGNAALDKKIAALWADWGHTAHAANRHSFAGLQRLSARAIVEGGEILWRRWRRPVSDGLPVPLQWQVMEGELINHLKNEPGDDGTRTLAGVRIDQSERRLGYWLYEQHPGDGALRTGAAARSNLIPAAQVLHCFEELRPGQVRGIPWLTPSIVRFRTLDDYEEAEQYRKRFEASFAAFVVGNETEGGNAASLLPQARDAAGNTIEMLEPGLVGYLNDASDVRFADPKDGLGFSPFKKSALQSISAGVGLTYEIVSGDLSQTNFSSIRFGVLGVRAMVRAVQRLTIVPQILGPAYREFIDAAIGAGLLPASTGYGHAWHPPAWEAIDPVKEATAILLRVRSGQSTLAQALAAEGYDIDTQIEEIARCNEILDRYKVILDIDPRLTNAKGAGQPLTSAPPEEDAETKPEAEKLIETSATGDRMAEILALVRALGAQD